MKEFFHDFLAPVSIKNVPILGACYPQLLIGPQSMIVARSLHLSLLQIFLNARPTPNPFVQGQCKKPLESYF